MWGAVRPFVTAIFSLGAVSNAGSYWLRSSVQREQTWSQCNGCHYVTNRTSVQQSPVINGDPSTGSEMHFGHRTVLTTLLCVHRWS